jgi:PAS domain S-box-containing protein
MKSFWIIKYLSIFIILIIAWNNGLGQNQNMVFEKISKEQGLSNNFINAISQDQKGFLWIGTWNGLFRYDGYQFKVYKPVESDPATISNGIRQFVEDNNDRIWIVSPTGLTMFDKKEDRFKCVYANDSLTGDYFTSLLMDSKGTLWLGTRSEGIWTLPVNNATDFNKTKPIFKRYEHDNNPNSVSTNFIFGAFEDKQSNIWISASNKMVDRYNPKTGNFEHYPINISNIEKQTSNVTMRFEDSDGLYWFATLGAGLISWDKKDNVFKQYLHEQGKNSISANVINHIRQAKDGILWISTDGGGISFYDKKTGLFDYCKYEATNPNSLSSNGIDLTFEDKSGVIWVGTANSGLNIDEAEKTNFGLHKPNPSDKNSLSYKSVTSIIEDKGGNYWIGTDGGGLNFWDRKTNNFKHFLHDPNNPNSISGNAVVCVAEDYEGDIWTGTYAHGVNCYKRKENKFIRFTHDPNNKYSLSDNNIWALLEDSKHNLWAAALQGTLDLYDRKTNRFYHYKNDPNDPNSFIEKYTTNLFEDSRHYLWIATSAGLEMVKLNDYDFNKPFPKLKFNHYTHENNSNSLSTVNVYCIFEDHEGNMWFGNDGGGLNNLNMKTNIFISYSDKDGLPDMSIKAILEDNDYNLWVSTTNGISKFNPKTKSFHTYDYTDGLQDYTFSNARCKSTDGKLLFGGPNGFNIFDPKSLTTNSIPPQVVLSDFKVYNNSVAVGQKIDGSIILRKSITETDTLIVSHKANFFSIEFAALDFTNPKKNRYAYKMEGFDDQWHTTDAKNRIATYTNLDPGEYTFRVKAGNNDGVWNEKGTSLKIIILPPWWQTLWFRFILLAVLVGIVFWVYKWRVQARDFAAQKRMEAALTKERNLLRTLIDNIPDAIYVKNTDCQKTIANMADVQNAGFQSEEDVLGKTDFDLFPKELAEGFVADDRTVMQTGQSVNNREEYVMNAQGEKRWLDTSKVPLRDEKGQTIGLVGIGRDITERKKAETERERLITELQDALADVKLLSGLVPICANCKKIRDDQGYWTQIESYIQDRSDAKFSHSICPDCAQKLYPEYMAKNKETENPPKNNIL